MYRIINMSGTNYAVMLDESDMVDEWEEIKGYAIEGTVVTIVNDLEDFDGDYTLIERN